MVKTSIWLNYQIKIKFNITLTNKNGNPSKGIEAKIDKSNRIIKSIVYGTIKTRVKNYFYDILDP